MHRKESLPSESKCFRFQSSRCVRRSISSFFHLSLVFFIGFKPSGCVLGVCRYLLLFQAGELRRTRLLQDFLRDAALDQIFAYVLGWKLLGNETRGAVAESLPPPHRWRSSRGERRGNLTSSPMMVTLGKRRDREAQMLCCAILSASVCRSLAPVCAEFKDSEGQWPAGAFKTFWTKTERLRDVLKGSQRAEQMLYCCYIDRYGSR